MLRAAPRLPLALLCLMESAAATQAELDQVSWLPGWESDAGQPLPLPSKHYSGHLPVRPSDDRQLHYYLITTQPMPHCCSG